MNLVQCLLDKFKMGLTLQSRKKPGWFFEECYNLFPIANLSKNYFLKIVFDRFF